MTTERTFVARYSRDDNGSWLVEAHSQPSGERLGIATHGRTIGAAESNLREALALWFDIDDEQSFTLLPSYALDEDVMAVAAEAAVRRDEARRAEAESVALMSSAVDQLVHTGLSVRDVAAILGISHQRVQQLVRSSGDDATPSAARVASPLGAGFVIGALAFLVVNGWLDYRKRKQERVLLPAEQPPDAAPPSPQFAQVLSMVKYRARKGQATVAEIAVAAGLSDLEAALVQSALDASTRPSG